MKPTKFFIFLTALAFFSGCSLLEPNHKMNPGGYTGSNKDISENNGEAKSSESEGQNLREVSRPQRVVDMMKSRGAQDEAKPILKVVEPANGATVNSSTVKIKLELGGDLNGYQPMKDPQTGMGNHIHVILDNQPYEAYYNLDQDFELRNVADGEHTLRFFPSRPWHESYKNDGAFQMVKFNVKNGAANTNQPTTTNSGNTMANANMSAATNATPEGKDMQNSTAGAVDAAKPLLTYSRPKGEYKGADADAIMIDFWLSNAKLVGDGGDYRARYSIDGSEAKLIDSWQPIWLSGWTNGKHAVKLELVDRNGNLVDNGGYNSTTREITITR